MCGVLITHLHPTKLTIVFLRNLPALDAQLTATHRRHNLQSFIGVRRANISNPHPSRVPVKAFHMQSFAVALCISSLRAALHHLSSHSSQQVHKQFSLAIGTISAPQLTIPVTSYVHAALAADPSALQREGYAVLVSAAYTKRIRQWGCFIPAAILRWNNLGYDFMRQSLAFSRLTRFRSRCLALCATRFTQTPLHQ